MAPADNTSMRSSTQPPRSGWFAWLGDTLKSPRWARQPRNSVPLLFSDAAGHSMVILTGLDCAGKTELLQRYLANGKGIVTCIPAIGVAVEAVRHDSVTFFTYDLGMCAPEKYKLVDRAMFHMADAVVYVVDSLGRERTLDARNELMMEGLMEKTGMRNEVPLLILANKQDFKDARRPDQLEQFFVDNISTSIGDRPVCLRGTSAISGASVVDAFTWLSEKVANHSRAPLYEKDQSCLVKEASLLANSVDVDSVDVDSVSLEEEFRSIVQPLTSKARDYRGYR